ncbi:MAG: hypothetical protein IJ250_06800 [Bacteroidales bacterium]|nr:hypothetical protein [Bacteroidales bacterium]
MKIWGIILIIAGICGFIQLIASAGQAPVHLGYTIIFLVLGIYLVHRANQKKQEQKDKENWDKGA